jgi:hypothetical protein
MQIVAGPIFTRDGGFAFEKWAPDKGLRRGYSYLRIEHDH